MIQLDAAGYREVEALIGPPPTERSSQRISQYEHAKRVVALGCTAVESEAICNNCKGLAAPLCEQLVELRQITE